MEEFTTLIFSREGVDGFTTLIFPGKGWKSLLHEGHWDGAETISCCVRGWKGHIMILFERILGVGLLVVVF